MLPRISVLVICYKQENLIRRAIDSLLSQKEYLYEICVSDDCSPDHTWDILQEYDKANPGLFKLHRNDHNVGIFENIEYSWTMPEGDLIYHLSGDDECGNGFFKAVLDCIEVNCIDYKHDLFCIYGDYLQLFPNEERILYKQKIAQKNLNSLSLKLRGLLSNRGACYSSNILKKFKNVSEGRSYIAESVQDCQLAIYTEKTYYVPVIGNIYYAAVGVSVWDSKAIEDIKKERSQRLFEFIEKESITIDSKTLAFLTFKKYAKLFSRTRSLKNLLNTICFFLKSIDFKLGVDGLFINEYMAIKKRRKIMQKKSY